MTQAKKNYFIIKNNFFMLHSPVFLSTRVLAIFEVTTAVIMKFLLVVHDAVKTGTLSAATTGTTPKWQVRVYASARRHIAENWRLPTFLLKPHFSYVRGILL
jgi:hypothetical protein